MAKEISDVGETLSAKMKMKRKTTRNHIFGGTIK